MKKTKFLTRLVSAALSCVLMVSTLTPTLSAYATSDSASTAASSQATVEPGTITVVDDEAMLAAVNAESESTSESSGSAASSTKTEAAASSAATSAPGAESNASSDSETQSASSGAASESNRIESDSSSQASSNIEAPSSEADSSSSEAASSSDASSGKEENAAGSEVTDESETSAEVEEEANSELQQELEEAFSEEFVVLAIEAPESGDTIAAEIGEDVTLTTKLNRDDVLVSYQWQRMQTKPIGITSKNTMYDYDENAPTWYNFLLEGTTETEMLAENPDATWRGIEMYYAIMGALDDIGADSSDVRVAWKTPNYILDGYTLYAKEVGDHVEVYAELDGQRFTAVLNEEGEWEFDDDSTKVTHVWEDIEGANEAEYTFMLMYDDYDAYYRCVVTILDEDYIAKTQLLAENAGIELTEEQRAADQKLMSVSYKFQSGYGENAYSLRKVRSFRSLVSTLALDNETTVSSGNPVLSDDAQWIEGLTYSYEYITKDTYDRVAQWLEDGTLDSNNLTVANRYWTALGEGSTKVGFDVEVRANVLGEDGLPVRDENGNFTGEVRYYRGFNLTDYSQKADGSTTGKLEVNSDWYGKTVYFRVYSPNNEWADKGVAIKIPAYTDLQKDAATGEYIEAASGTLYKKAITVLNPFVPDVGPIYEEFIRLLTAKDPTSTTDTAYSGWLLNTTAGAANDHHITMLSINCEDFNADPARYMVDAEGNYRVDTVAWGVCCYEEPDLSGKAYWQLKDYIANGYGMLVGHDTMYAYAGSYYDAYKTQFDESTIDPEDGLTWYYKVNSYSPVANRFEWNRATGEIIAELETSTTRGGHFYLNELMGSNKGNVNVGNVSPSDAVSMILSYGGSHDYGKRILLGSRVLEIVDEGYTGQQARSNPKFRTPTNYPYAFAEGQLLSATFTHTNHQVAFGPIWVRYGGDLTDPDVNDYADFGYETEPKYFTLDGKTGTNNFYLSGTGNFLMNQIGHVPQNSAQMDETNLLANTLFFLSQRKQCEICAANQGGHATMHFVRRVNSANAKEVLDALRSGGSYWYPIDGCYMLTEDLDIASLYGNSWTPIEGFAGHWNSDIYDVILPTGVTTENAKLMKNTGTSIGKYNTAGTGWNLGDNRIDGIVNVFRTNGSGERVTGVARVVGDLRDLFVGSGVESYAGYTVKIYGSDNPKYFTGVNANEVYTCTVNSDSKYVISNLPCVYFPATATTQRTGVLFARVYDPSGNEVTQYGTIKVDVDANFWNTCETTPLYLGDLKAEPVLDAQTYENAQAKFTSTAEANASITVVGWQYRENNTGTWKDIPSGWSKAVTNSTVVQLEDGTYTVSSTLLLKNVSPEWDGYEFRARFKTAENGTWNSYGYYQIGNKVYDTGAIENYKGVAKDGYKGKLTVKTWPAQAMQSADKSVYEAESATFTATGLAVSKQGSFTATWQYSTQGFDSKTGKNILVWHDMDSRFQSAVSTTHARQTSNASFTYMLHNDTSLAQQHDLTLFYQNAPLYTCTSTLTLSNLDISSLDNASRETHFRVKFTAESNYGTKQVWYSDIADNLNDAWNTEDKTYASAALVEKPNNANVLTIKRPELYVVMKEATSNQDTATPDVYGQKLSIETDANGVSSVKSGQKATYKAIVYYNPNKAAYKPTVSWQYKTYADTTIRAWNQTAANNLGYTGMTVTITNGTPYQVTDTSDPNYGYMAIDSTMTLTNVPVGMYDTPSQLKYYFRCTATNTYNTYQGSAELTAKTNTQTDDWGGLVLDYNIRLNHNGVHVYGKSNIVNNVTVTDEAGISTQTTGQEYSVWGYPELEITEVGTNKINTVIVTLNDYAAGSAIVTPNKTAITNLGITIHEQTTDKLHLIATTEDGVETADWNKALSQYVRFKVYDNIEDGDTAKVNWYADEQRIDGTVDKNTGHAYKVVTTTDPISWDDAKAAAQAYDSGIGANGHLVEINNATENALVKSLLNGKEGWIGSYNSNGTWKFANSNKTMSYFNWTTGSGLTKTGTVMYMKADGSWNSNNGQSSAAEKKVTYHNLTNYKMKSYSCGPVALIYLPKNNTQYSRAGIAVGVYRQWITGWPTQSTFQYSHSSHGDIGLSSVYVHSAGGQLLATIAPTWGSQRNFFDQLGVEIYPRTYQTYDFDLVKGETYYLHLKLGSYGDNDGCCAWALMTENGYVDAYRAFVPCTHAVRSGGANDTEYTYVFTWTGNTTKANIAILHTGDYNTSNPAKGTMSADATLYALDVVNLTDTFGTNAAFEEVWKNSGYSSAKDFCFAEIGDSRYTARPLLKDTTKTYYMQTSLEINSYVVEYDLQPMSMVTNNHSAQDADTIFTGKPELDKEPLVVNIEGATKTYDGSVIVPSVFTVNGPAWAGDARSLVQVTYEAIVDGNKADYAKTTVAGTNYADTKAVNATTYKATVSLTTAARDAGWTIDTANSNTVAYLVIEQRPLYAYSYNNDKTYNGLATAVVNNILFEAPTTVSGVVSGDTVSLNTTTIYGHYTTDGASTRTVNSTKTASDAAVHNNGNEWVIVRDTTISALNILHNSSSDPHENYYLAGESFSGDIYQRPVFVHSRYLDDATDPRNVKTYDGTTAATITRFIIDAVPGVTESGLVTGDDITVTQTLINGEYASKDASETLNNDGTRKENHLLKLSPIKITPYENATLSGDVNNNYYIAQEEYTGAIARENLTAQVKGWRGMYGIGVDEKPWHDTKAYGYNTRATAGCWLKIDGLVENDTLLLNYSKSNFQTLDVGNTSMVPDKTTPVGYYTLTYKGLTQANYSVLKNYVVQVLNGTFQVYARPVTVSVVDTEKMVNDENPVFHSIFSMMSDDGETYTVVGDDTTDSYENMKLAANDTVWNSILVKPQASVTTTRLVKDSTGKSNITYLTECTVDSPAKYLDMNSLETYPCEFCEQYHGFTTGTDHWRLAGYPITINTDSVGGNTLEVAYVTNPKGEKVQNYELTLNPGIIMVHPELRLQLKATVPMYVCMYGFNGDGNVLEPENYGITNYSNGAIQISNINVSDDGWVLRDAMGIESVDPADWSASKYFADRNTLQAGEMYMRLMDTTLKMGDNTPSNQLNWVIDAGDPDNDIGVFKRVPVTAYIASGNVNDAGCSYITRVTYTIAEYGLTLPEQPDETLPDSTGGLPVTPSTTG